jgi:hypothetical protein
MRREKIQCFKQAMEIAEKLGEQKDLIYDIEHGLMSIGYSYDRLIAMYYAESKH